MLNLDGREIGGCKLIRKIGAGGMGEVYLAEQLRVGNRQVAVKIVSLDDAALRSQDAEDVAKRFQREAATLGGLSHPNILPVHDSGVQDDLLYLVMAYAPDGSLSDAIKGNSKHPLKLPASIPFVTDVIGQIAAALQYVHDRGIVHRDVKPGNMLVQVEPDGHWRMLLADFGIARGVDTSGRTQVTGTFLYMAPEQFSGTFSPKSDQYALAVMAYQLLAGRPPFEGELAALTRAHIYDNPPPLRGFNAAVSPALEAAINRALAKDPNQRFPSVAAFAQALSQGANAPAVPASVDATHGNAPTVAAAPPPLPIAPVPSGPAPQCAPQPGPPTRRTGPGRILVTALASVLLLVAIIGGIGLAQRQSGGGNATATQTAQAQTATAGTQPTATATASSTATGQPSVTVGPGGTATVVGPPAPIVPFCQQALGLGDDATCVPRPPSAITSQPILFAPAPSCDGQGSWTVAQSTNRDCSQRGTEGVVIAPTQPNALGCVYAQSAITTSGYASILVHPSSGGDVVLGVLNSQSGGSGNVFYITGYYLQISAAQQSYRFYKELSGGEIDTIATNTLSGPLAAHFVVSVLYGGGNFTFYVNGNQVGTATDPTFTQGWLSLCASGGSVGERDALLYQG
jgi:tRNA A-37 threonylcarbamoyl transferase component Bud32